MSLPKHYYPHTTEPALQARWQQTGIYHFDPDSSASVFSIDTPPPTVSGKLHLGHTFSYSHPDFIARFQRMNQRNIFYPMGFDDNGLPTERLVIKSSGLRAPDIGREAFIKACLEISEQSEKTYMDLWQRLGLSIDWHYTYRTIEDPARAIAQLSFIRLYQQGLVYRKESPTIWCPECHTAIAQAELNDIDLTSALITLRFELVPEQGMETNADTSILIGTTRPELLPACVAIFVHPQDERYSRLPGKTARVPLFGQHVQIFTDPQVDPDKGTGIVMCCTFGDQTDIAWWREYNLPVIEAIDQQGKMTSATSNLQGLSVLEARSQIIMDLKGAGAWCGSQPLSHTIRTHERCDTPVEYLSTRQWFIRILDSRDRLRQAGEQVNWYPAHMKSRFLDWVDHLNWDWCISRQRYFGVPFPIWYCQDCGATMLATEEHLPIDPAVTMPSLPCSTCGGITFQPEEDVMDTWATSSLSPQIVGQWLENPRLFKQVFPFSLRPQAHEIIRTWAFYTIAKSHFHFSAVPWKDALISGWGIAGEGSGKISKSRGGGPMPPIEMIEKYAADAVRYWAASTGPGKDAIISEEKIQVGMKLITKIWHVSRFCSQFIQISQSGQIKDQPPLTPADRWILSRTQNLVRRVTDSFNNYDYAAAKADTETFFWNFADNYIEMAKQRLYDPDSPLKASAQFTIHHVLLTLLKVFAPILPHITEAVYLGVFMDQDDLDTTPISIHTATWPSPDPSLMDEKAESVGELLVEIATLVRRHKSENNLALGTEISGLRFFTSEPALGEVLHNSKPDLFSITRAANIDITPQPDPELASSWINPNLQIKIVL